MTRTGAYPARGGAGMTRAGAIQAWVLRHRDPLLALVLLAWALSSTAARHSHRGPLAVNLALVAVIGGSLLLRRRAPLAYAAITFAAAAIGAAWFDNVARTAWSVYVLVVPAYSVAAQLEVREALLGLAICLIGPAIVDLFDTHVVTDLLFTTIAAITAWSTGRALRHRRALAGELRQRAARVAAERDDRERLAVAAERSRIARELHAVVANNVTAMVVKAAAAQRLLDDDPDDADRAMAEIESTGRAALSEMRRILGVLRCDDDRPELAPQPGVEQLHTLLEQARATNRDVALRVSGEPGPLPVSVDLAVYRLVEEALSGSQGPADVVLTFDGAEVQLEVSGQISPSSGWPTLAMHERVALCEGTLTLDDGPGTGDRLLVRLPRAFEGAFA